MPVSKKPRKKGQRARDLAVRKKFVRGKFKDADDARRTIASLERQKTRQRRRCEQLGWLLGFQEKDSLLSLIHICYAQKQQDSTGAIVDGSRLLSRTQDASLLQSNQRFCVGDHAQTRVRHCQHHV